MSVAVIQFPGSNRDQDMLDALAHTTGKAPHNVWHADTSLPAGTQAVVLPGAFPTATICAAVPSLPARRSWPT